MQLSWFITLSYSFLFFSIMCLWSPPVYRLRQVPLWVVFAGIACGLALLSRQLDFPALLPLALLAAALYYAQKKEAPLPGRFLAVAIILLLSFGLGAHAIPYFHNLKVLSGAVISKNAVPFTLYLNFDKAFVGLFILGISHRLITTKKDWLAILKQTLPFSLIFAVLLLFSAWLSGKINVEPKLPEILPLWLINNLLIVSVAEEAFFRGFVQKKLSLAFARYSWGTWASLTLASLLFGFAHYAGGIAYSAWGTLAGFGYGWIYQKTGHIEAAIIAHFCLNLLHILLFTYPVLSGS
ncbi:MAG: family intrarane metalloprotease [Firmicutes bacterium]|nr:family intrarane metalloprotease [Bacillota bacterium]